MRKVGQATDSMADKGRLKLCLCMSLCEMCRHKLRSAAANSGFKRMFSRYRFRGQEIGWYFTRFM